MIKIPIIIGKNRLRGSKTGAMVAFDESDGVDHLATLRSILNDEAVAKGFLPSTEWLTNAVRDLLKMYEHANACWEADNSGAIGHCFEANLPSGIKLLFGDARVLARINQQSGSLDDRQKGACRR